MALNRLIRFDWAIKHLLRNKANFGILEGFLSELLMEDVKIIEILESESNKATADDKSNRVDMLVKNSNSELIIIEVQNTFEHDYFQSRVLGSTSKLITEYISKGKTYMEVKKVISINIVYFDIGQGKDYIYKGITEFKGMHEHDILQLNEKQKIVLDKRHIEDIFPKYYILKVNNFNNLSKDTLDEWIYFLKNADLPKRYSAKGLKEANNKLKVLKMSEKERKEYEHYLINLMDERSIANSQLLDIKLAEMRGVEKVLSIAKKMIIHGLSIKDIMEMTALSKEEIESL